MVVSCARCGHPGVHAMIMPASGGGGPGRCPNCPYCQREIAQEQAAKGSVGAGGRRHGQASDPHV